MDPEEEKRITDEIIKNRRLPYSIEILDASGDKFTVRSNFGHPDSKIVYIKKGENYLLEEELK